MNDRSHEPRLSRALVVGWLVLTLLISLWPLYSYWQLESAMLLESAEIDWERYATIAELRWIVSRVFWMTLLVGLWNTAKAQDSPRLRIAFGLSLAQFGIATGLSMAMKQDLIAPDAAWIQDLFNLTLVLQFGAGLAVIANALGRGVESRRLVWVTGVQFIWLVLDFSALAIATALELEAPSIVVMSVIASLLYWLSWLSVPRKAFALGESKDDAQAVSSLRARRVSPAQDLSVGAMWACGGALLTYFSFSSGGIGGRAVFAYGPIIYGLFRVVRGLIARG